ncbi:MAG: chromosome segregation ATPase [Verrucomicrobiales bacterium]|jgi:chromosome segregation ATPase
MIKLMKVTIVLMFIASLTAGYLSIKIFQDRETIKLRTQTLEKTVTQMATHLKFEERAMLQAKLLDKNAMQAPLRSLSSHAQLTRQDLESEQQVNAELTGVLDQTRDALKSTEVQLAESQSVGNSLEQDKQRLTSELARAQSRVEVMTGEKEAIAQQLGDLKDTIAQNEINMAGLEQDVIAEKAESEHWFQKYQALANKKGSPVDDEIAGEIANIVRVLPEYNYVVIDMGSTRHLKPDNVATIFNGNTFIGRLRIKEVNNDQAIGEYQHKEIARPIAIGDQIVFIKS